MLLNIAIGAIRSILGNKDLMGGVQRIVLLAFDFNLTNVQKKAEVMGQIKGLGMTFGKIIAPISTALLSSIVELYFSKAVLKNPALKSK